MELKNTGTVPAKITTNFWWLMGDGSKLAAKTLTVTLNPGKSRLVFFKMDVGQTVVDNFQSHPDYNRSKNC